MADISEKIHISGIAPSSFLETANRSLGGSCPCKFRPLSPDFGKPREPRSRSPSNKSPQKSPKKKRVPAPPQFDWEATREETLLLSGVFRNQFEGCYDSLVDIDVTET